MTDPSVEDRPPRLVLDTNAALDWLVFKNRSMGPVAAAILTGQVCWLACSAMREELRHMLGHASLARWQPDEAGALAVFDGHTCLLEPPRPSLDERLACTDSDDQVFIDLAVLHRAQWLVTHDRALLKLARRARRWGVAVIRPVDWPPGNAVGP